jgi:6-phosphogluconolactonase
MEKTEIIVFHDLEALSREGARIFAATAKESINLRGIFSAALSGGRTPARFYEILGSQGWKERIAWPKVHLFWADERCVSPGSQMSNFHLLRQTLLSRVDLPQENIHRVRGEDGARKGAALYEKEIRDFFGQEKAVFDLITLGVGTDGHTASLFPGSSVLRMKGMLAAPVMPEQGGVDRVTLTLTTINRARNVIFLVSGAEKAQIMGRILGGADTRDKYPAGLVRPRKGILFWLMDEAAAGGLGEGYAISEPQNFSSRP